MISNKKIINELDKLIPNPRCELIYHKDYELLLATVLSAQSTDKMVNEVTKELFKYNLEELNNLSAKEIERIIKPVGTYTRKAFYIKEIVKKIINDYKGVIPNNREYLESLPGVGRKTANVVLANLFNVEAIAVDTHVNRVSKRLGIANPNDDVLMVENKLMHFFPKNKWSRLHHQLVLFGRYTCKSSKPDCSNCPFIHNCQYQK
jgi:endonuclease-3